MVLSAGLVIIQRRLFYPLQGVAECSGMGWRNGSEQDGGINRIAMAESPGILSHPILLKRNFKDLPVKLRQSVDHAALD